MGTAAVGEADMQLSIRRSMLRACGGVVMRLVAPMGKLDVQVWLAVESGDDDLIASCLASCKGPACCFSPAARAFYQWLSSASVDALRLAKLSWSPSILSTEGDHGGNQRRMQAKQAKTRV